MEFAGIDFGGIGGHRTGGARVKFDDFQAGYGTENAHAGGKEAGNGATWRYDRNSAAIVKRGIAGARVKDVTVAAMV
jgi:hypothetical protein